MAALFLALQQGGKAMDSLFHNFSANRSLFFNLFDQATKNIVEMASLLLSSVNNEQGDDPELIYKQVDKMENAGDDITHKIYLCLDKVIFTPLSRNDIHALASAIDDLADTIQEASGRMYLYYIDEFTPAIKEITAIILKSTLEIERAVSLLRSRKKTNELPGICVQIKTYERESARIYCQAVVKVFAEEKNPIRLLKYNDILQSLETAVNKCKKVTDVLSTISINR